MEAVMKRVALVVPPVHAVANEYGHGYLPPLGLLAVAGPLVDAGFGVELLDADAGHASQADIHAWLCSHTPDIVLIGHSGSVSAHPSALETIATARVALPTATLVYGGPTATFAVDEVMRQAPGLDFIVCGEGERTTLELLASGPCAGAVWREGGRVVCGPPRPPSACLDTRVAWELVDWSLYENHQISGRAAVVQFSRGCPNRCTYCGQWRFWRSWRHRSIASFIDELRLLREHDVRTVFLADENWASDPDLLHQLLAAIADADLGMSLFCAMCAEDVVRDAEWLPLYRRAGVVCLMMGVESLDDEVLVRVGKRNPRALTRRAVELLRAYDILSVVNVIYGLGDETWRSLLRTARRVRAIAPDFFNALHLTPLPWTVEARRVQVLQPDWRRWDYRHPVVEPRRMSFAGMAVAVKLSELFVYARLGLLRKLFARDALIRRMAQSALPRAMRIFLSECWSLTRLVFRIRRAKRAPVASSVQNSRIAVPRGRGLPSRS